MMHQKQFSVHLWGVAIAPQLFMPINTIVLVRKLLGSTIHHQQHSRKFISQNHLIPPYKLPHTVLN
ncbi:MULTISPECIES: hypothetical protein [unclassified Nostoc]|uniref:hypothetical protein n=1 Tax=unclassified Nostoc TaxID=2593658 RepID=UPI0025F79815|nr:hypothetical protein [Nostoc sp. JL33]MBN3874337.1 hypothetical protein [Nostoc sp. JL33]